MIVDDKEYQEILEMLLNSPEVYEAVDKGIKAAIKYYILYDRFPDPTEMARRVWSGEFDE